MDSALPYDPTPTTILIVRMKRTIRTAYGRSFLREKNRSIATLITDNIAPDSSSRISQNRRKLLGKK
jgi:hypothetical protein